MRTTLLKLCAVLGVCAAFVTAAVGSAEATGIATLPFNPVSQSHPGACSRSTTNVAQAVSDLQANGVLAQYAQMLGIHGSSSSLPADLRRALTVATVSGTTVTDNHGCNGSGLVFDVGPRLLTPGETVGVALPAALRARLCSGPGEGCERIVYTAHTVLPTNCWNIDDGTVRVTLYVKRVKPATKIRAQLVTRQPKPSARAVMSCTKAAVVVTLANGRRASVGATFVVDGKHHGPVAAGKHLTVKLELANGASRTVTVYSSGKQLIAGHTFTNRCAAPRPQPSATAAQSCSAGGVTVTLANGASATASATFTVNGTSYGPLAPGATQTVTIPIAPGSSATVTVSSGSASLINSQTFTSSCAAAPGATAELLCNNDNEGGSGGTIVVQLSDGMSATLPASFSVSATGNTVAGFGPTDFGPVAPGASATVYVPVDASYGFDQFYDIPWPPITLTVTAGGKTVLSQTFDTGCGFVEVG